MGLAHANLKGPRFPTLWRGRALVFLEGKKAFPALFGKKEDPEWMAVRSLSRVGPRVLRRVGSKGLPFSWSHSSYGAHKGYRHETS